MIAASATRRRMTSIDRAWRRVGRAVVLAGIALLAMSSVFALMGTALYVAAHPVVLQQLFVHLVVWWRWLG